MQVQTVLHTNTGNGRADGGGRMPRKRPKGTWDTPEGQETLRAYQAGEILAEDAAKRMKTTTQALYSAVSRARALKPQPISQEFMSKLEELAQIALPEVVANLRARVNQLESEVHRLEGENSQLRHVQQQARTTRDEAAERILRRAREVSGGDVKAD